VKQKANVTKEQAGKLKRV